MSCGLGTTTSLSEDAMVSKPRRWYVPLWLVMGGCSWYLLIPTWIAAIKPIDNHVIDFYQDWASARNYWTGLPIYTPHSITVPRYLQLPCNPIPSIEYNIHPPSSVLLALPLGQLAYADSIYVWNVISLLALVLSLAIVIIVLPSCRSVLLPARHYFPFAYLC